MMSLYKTCFLVLLIIAIAYGAKLNGLKRDSNWKWLLRTVVLRQRALSLIEALTKSSTMDMDKYDFEALKIEILNVASYDEKRTHVLMSAAYVCTAVLVALVL